MREMRSGRKLRVFVPLALLLAGAVAVATEGEEPGRDDREMAHVLVHEWGVMTYGLECSAQLLSRPEYPLPIEDEPVVTRAPVVHFYGPEFTGDFRVETSEGGGRIFDTHPCPSYTSPDQTAVEWRDIICNYNISREMIRDDLQLGPVPDTGDHYWPMHLWREAECMVITDGAASFEEKFLYYEVALPALPLSTPLVHTRGGGALTFGFESELLVFDLDETGQTVVMHVEDASALEGTFPARWEGAAVEGETDVLDVLYEWSRDEMEIEEINELWRTWSGYLMSGMDYGRTGGTAVVLYRLPAETVEEICSIELITEEGYPVEYSRFMLAAMTIRSPGL